jgi:hypothetical protein
VNVPSSFSRSSSSSLSDLRSITSGDLLALTLASSLMGSSASLMIGDETFDNACLACLRGRAIALAPFLMCLIPRLMPRSIAFVLDLAALDMEDDEMDQRDERDDFAEDFVEDMSKSTQKNVNVLLTFICPSQISIYCVFSSGSGRLYDAMRAIELEGAVLSSQRITDHKFPMDQIVHMYVNRRKSLYVNYFGLAIPQSFEL